MQGELRQGLTKKHSSAAKAVNRFAGLIGTTEVVPFQNVDPLEFFR